LLVGGTEELRGVVDTVQVPVHAHDGAGDAPTAVTWAAAVLDGSDEMAGRIAHSLHGSEANRHTPLIVVTPEGAPGRVDFPDAATLVDTRDEAGFVEHLRSCVDLHQSRMRMERELARLRSREIELVGRCRELERAVAIDPVTGVHRRQSLLEALRRAHARAERESDYDFAIAFIDLDNFKLINDSYGHAVGDAVVMHTAQRLKAFCRKYDFVARMGGDEFAILLEQVGGGMASSVGERLHRQVCRPVEVEGQRVPLTASIGLTTYRSRPSEPNAMLRDADTAMYRCKRAGRNQVQVFDPALHEQLVRDRRVAGELAGAFDRGEVLPYYQPIVDLGDRTVVGFEALVRWKRDDQSVLRPESFLSAAGRGGLMARLFTVVAQQSCERVMKWSDQVGRALTVSVNVSMFGLYRPTLAAEVQRLVERNGLAPGQLRLEVTEDTVLRHPVQAAQTIARLRDAGAVIYLDDFGVGNVSVPQVRDLAVAGVKIDGRFIAELATLDSGRDLVRGIVRMAEGLRVDVIAEGVESVELAAACVEMGCRRAQGFALAQPMVWEEVAPWLQR